MIIKTLQWNIGGGKIRRADADPTDPLNYSEDGIEAIISLIKEKNPDIITLQETHRNSEAYQAEVIAQKLGYYFVNDIYDHSHLEEGQELGQAIISKFPIKNQKFEFFYNPKLETTGPRGEVWISHDKGFSSCTLDCGQDLAIGTMHLFPFRKFGLTPSDPEANKIIGDIDQKILSLNKPFLLQADFNIDEPKVGQYFKNLADASEIKIADASTPKGRRYDHIIFNGLKLESFEIKNDVLTDHYPLIAEFEI